MLRFSTSQQSSVANGIKALVYSGSGAGKTVLTVTLPKPILLSAEAGVLSLHPENIKRIFGPNAAGITYNMPMIQISTVDELTEAYNWFTKSHEARQFESIALDSLSEIAEVVLNNAKRQVKDPRQAYGELLEKMETLIRYFRDIPGRNVLMTAKMEPSRDELTGIVKYMPAMPGSKLGPKLPYFFDEVFRLGVNKTQQGETYRFLQTQPDIQYDAKDRSGALQAVEYPHMSYLMGKIFSSTN